MAYDAYLVRRVDDEALRRHFDADFRFRMRPEWPGQATYTLDELPVMWADLDENLEDYELVTEEFIEADEHVVVRLSSSSRLRGSTSRIAGTVFHVWHFRNGRPVEARTFADRSQAVEDAGLRE